MRSLRRALFCTLSALTLALQAASPVRSAAPSRTFAIARAPYTFSFPRDHAAHPDYQTEWWYYTGHLRTRDGRRFGYELTFFRFGLRPGDPPPGTGQSRWRGNDVFPAHFAITDENGGHFFHAERFTREALGAGEASHAKLDVRSGDWTLAGTPLADPRLERMTLHASDGSSAVDLVQIPEKPPAIHGEGGISKKGPCASCASHYYSYTRLRSHGTLRYGGRTYAVDGLSWMDHEYGSSELQADQVGWDWFAIQLDDRREVMLYLLRRKDGSFSPESSGSLVERDGSVRHLVLAAFSQRALGTWHSPHTGADYPSGWHVDVPSAGLHLDLLPTVADQELAESNVSYWEGAVNVRDAAGKPLGLGYVELTGYAGTVAF